MLSPLGGSPSAQAGCHAPDRPVLSMRLSWERDDVRSADLGLEDLAPPILTHPPCPLERPHHSAPSNAAIGPALASHDALTRQLPGHGSLPPFDLLTRFDPCGSRLDRPPRAFA